MAEALKTPEQAGQETADKFSAGYREEIAISLKSSWDAEKMGLLGFPKAPSDQQFQTWANQLISERKITYTDPNDPSVKPELSISQIQSSLSEPAKAEMKAKFKTDELNDIILSNDQVNTVSVALGETTAENTGEYSFLKGATMKSAFMGFINWIGKFLNSFFNGEDPGTLENAIKQEAVKNAGNDAKENLKTKAPGIKAGVRDYIANQYSEAAERAAGLKPPATERHLKDVPLGSAAIPGAGASTAPATTKITLSGKPQEDLPLVFGSIADDTLGRLGQDLNKLSADQKAKLVEAKKIFSAEGARIAKENPELLKDPNKFADAVVAATAEKFPVTGNNEQEKKANELQKKGLLIALKKVMVERHSSIVDAAEGKGGSIATPTANAAPLIDAKTIALMVEESLRQNTEGLKSIESLAGKPLADANIKALSGAVAEGMAKNSPVQLAALGGGAYEKLSDDIYAAMRAKRSEINEGGLALDDDKLRVIADKIAVETIRGDNPNAPAIPPNTLTAMLGRQEKVVGAAIKNETVKSISTPGNSYAIDHGNNFSGWITTSWIPGLGNTTNKELLAKDTSEVLVKLAESPKFNELTDPEQRKAAIINALATKFTEDSANLGIVSAEAAARIAETIGSRAENSQKLPHITLADGSDVRPLPANGTVATGAKKPARTQQPS